MKRSIHIIALVLVLVLADVSVARGDSLPDTAFVSGFVGHAQSYAIDCEVRSAVDWAGFWGVSIGETEFLEALPRTDNPDKGFVGDPNDVWGRIPPFGYGVHADPIAETLRDFGLNAEARHGLSWDDLRGEIDAGHPVIVWIIGAMWEGTPVQYDASDGSSSTVAAYEHTMTLVGYTSDAVQVVDSSSGHLDTYRLNDFLISWTVLGNMAVVGANEQVSADDLSSQEAHVNTNQGASQDINQSTNQDLDQSGSQNNNRSTAQNNNQSTQQNINQNTDQDTLQITNTGTYTIQKGDWVMALARRFGISWLELAQLNALNPPYIIYVGQVLQLPAVNVPEAAPETAETPVTMSTDNFLEYLPTARRHEALVRMFSVDYSQYVLGLSDPLAASHPDARLNYEYKISVDVSLLAKLNSLRPSYIFFPGWMLRLQ
jgi:uncharacterized protein YvpB/LysM repeat protein